MAVATKNELLALTGPEPISETAVLPDTGLYVVIRGLVRSAARAVVYREIDEMVHLRDITIDGERIAITEDDVVAACWASACVSSPKLSSYEWLTVGARNADLLTFVGSRCLVCSRLLADEGGKDGVAGAEGEFMEGRDPLDFSRSGSVSTDLGGFPEKSTKSEGELESDSIKSSIA